MQFWTLLDVNLKEQLVCGVRDPSLKKKLFDAKAELTWEKALQICQQYEATSLNLKGEAVKPEFNVMNVHEMNSSNIKSNFKCKFCRFRSYNL